MREWREDIAERLELCAEAVGLMKVTVSGKRRVLVEFHRGILEYGPDCIEVAVRGGRVRVLGSALKLTAMDGEAVLVTGAVSAVELE